MSELTHILDRAGQGDPQAAEEILPVVYEELRKLAAHKMSNELPGQTLQPTALVHEAWLRLVGNGHRGWHGRGHFFAAAAEAMRRILVERARRKQCSKHGGNLRRIELTNVDVAETSSDDQIVAVDEALDKFSSVDPQGAKLVELRFFIGLSNIEAARLLGIPERTATRSWAYARAWLHEELRKAV